MKRWIAIILAGMLLLCGCAQEEPAQDSLVPDSIPVVVPIGERTEEGVKVTIHEGLLGMDTEVLTDTQIADGFLSGVRNEDGSVTYTIDAAKYDAFRDKKYQNTCQNIVNTVNDSFASVTDVSYAEDFSTVTLTVRRADYEFGVDVLAVFAVGSMAIIYQAYDIDAPGTCVITVVDENGERVSQNVYPDELVL